MKDLLQGASKAAPKGKAESKPAETVVEAKVADLKPIPERKAQVSRINLGEAKPEDGAVVVAEDGEGVFKPAVGTRAEQVFKYTEETDSDQSDKTVQKPSPKGQEGKTESAPAEADKAKVIIPKKFEGKTLEEVVASYTELESLTTKLAQRNVDLEKGAGKKEEAAPVKIELTDELKEKFYEKPEEAFQDLLKMATAVAEKTLEAKKVEASKKTKEQDLNETLEWVKKNRKDVLENPEYAKMVDGIAAVAQGETHLERYKSAIAEFDKVMGKVAETTAEKVKKEMAESQQEKEAATLPTGAAGSQGAGKVWKRSEIDRLILKDPANYVRQQKEIAKALQEGRVREDI